MSRAKKLKKKEIEEINNSAKNLKNGEGSDTSPYVHQNQKIRFSLDIHQRYELTERQKIILETMLDKHTNCVFIDGIYGSSKTYLSVLASLQLLNDKKVDQILYIRNPCESSTTGKIGFLPSSLEMKFAPYASIFFDKVEELIPKSQVDALNKDKHLEMVPLGFIRGKSWNCKAIIVDEASSMSYDDIILLLTRCGKYTKIFFVGDSINQNDIGSKAGFRKIFESFDDLESKENGVFTFELKNQEDIVRSGAVRFYLKKLGMIKY